MVDKSGPRVRQMFGEIADRYDRMNHLLSMSIDRYWRRCTTRLVVAPAGGRVLDVCTGTGDLALAYDRACRGQVEIVGADFCREMLVLGQAKSEQRGAARRISFLEADAQALPLPDNHFDVVTVAFGLRNVADTEQGLAEMTRVCKPGGQVAVLEFSSPQRQPFKAVYGWYFRNVLPRIGQLLSRNKQQAYAYLPESVGEFPQGAALAERMAAVGIENVRFHGLTLGVATLYVGEKPA